MEKKTNLQKVKIILPKPFPAQSKVVKACSNAYTKYIMVNGSRQAGKTKVSILIALMWALEEQLQQVMFVSPTDGQVKKIYKEVMAMIGGMPFVFSHKSQSGDAEIRFRNGSAILFRSAAQEDSLRGYSNTHLILDEAAYIKEETYNTILAPTLTVKGKKTLFCSTPRGKNYFYKLFMKGKEDMNVYKSYILRYLDNPRTDLEFINQQREILPDEVFAQEYMGEFVDSASIFNSIGGVATLKPVKDRKSSDTYYQGIDIAFKKDYTVVITFNQRGEMVDMVRFRQVDARQMRAIIKDCYNRWKPNKVFIESNNQGLPIYMDLKNEGLWNLQAIDTTGANKPEMINQLMHAFNSGTIKLLDDEVLKEEFKAFGYTISKSGNLKFAATYGHDDIVMATAIAWDCVLKNRYMGGYAVA